MKIGIDVDGTVYPWTVAANELAMDRFGIDDPGAHTSWNHLKDMIEPEQFAWMWTAEAAVYLFGRMDLIYPGAQSVINALCADHDVHFVTHRSPQKTGALTANYLNRNFEGYKGIHVLDNSVKKSGVLGWDIFIDDKPETVQEFLSETTVDVLMPDRPWNDYYANYRFTTFADWLDVPAIIAAL